jgi:hypothetical protein
VTNGGDYTIEHKGSGAIYSACQHVEPVNGVIKNGPGARFVVDIPPYSSRTYAYRVKAPAAPFKLQVQTWKGDTMLQAFSATADRDLTALAATSPIRGLYRDQLYTFAVNGKELQLASGTGVPLSSFISTMDTSQFGQYNMYYSSWADDDRTEEERFVNLYSPLFATSLNLKKRSAANTFSLPDDRVRLFVFAPMPESFQVSGNELGSQRGYVLYTIDVFEPDQQ